jgi:hypothetical protein
MVIYDFFGRAISSIFLVAVSLNPLRNGKITVLSAVAYDIFNFYSHRKNYTVKVKKGMVLI